jgi:hypothetical protein
MKLHLHSPILLHGMVLSYLNTETILHFSVHHPYIDPKQVRKYITGLLNISDLGIERKLTTSQPRTTTPRGQKTCLNHIFLDIGFGPVQYTYAIREITYFILSQYKKTYGSRYSD